MGLGGTGPATLQKGPKLNEIGETSETAFRDQFNSPRDYLMFRPVKGMTHQLAEVKSQLSNLQRNRDAFQYRPLVGYDDEDNDDS